LKKFSISIFFIICFAVLSNCVVFSEPQNTQPVQQTQKEVVSGEEIPETIPEKNYENLMKIKDSPKTSKAFNVIVSLVALIILGVLGFAGYKFYKKISTQNYIISSPPDETLETPKDFKTAINLFLEKTDD